VCRQKRQGYSSAAFRFKTVRNFVNHLFIRCLLENAVLRFPYREVGLCARATHANGSTGCQLRNAGFVPCIRKLDAHIHERSSKENTEKIQTKIHVAGRRGTVTAQVATSGAGAGDHSYFQNGCSRSFPNWTCRSAPISMAPPRITFGSCLCARLLRRRTRAVARCAHSAQL
jgi:hypothetical protein